MEIRLDSGTILEAVGAIGTLAGLYGFGARFDRSIERWTRNHIDEGYAGLQVAVGVGVTLLGVSPWFVVISARADMSEWAKAGLILVALLAGFAASGVPMIHGDIRRHLIRRQATMDAYLEEVRR